MAMRQSNPSSLPGLARVLPVVSEQGRQFVVPWGLRALSHGALMNEHESLLAAISEDVRLDDYNPEWPGAFAAERERLVALLPRLFVELQHVGSTAVPGLSAKPIIDVLAGVRSMAETESLAERICKCGYTTSAEFNATLSERLWFMRWANGHRTHHLHVVAHGGEVWHEHLNFRDALRFHPELAARYAALKFELAQRHSTDRAAYTDAKSEFVRSVLQSA
jgi:GrpB-like predicted nucleotidyltransferase (UPF0157 family)